MEFGWKEPEEFELLDFLMQARIGSLLHGTDTWWPLGDDSAAFKSQLFRNCADGVAILDDSSKKWSNPDTFLHLVPPPALVAEVPIPGVRPDNPAGTSRPLLWDIFPGWQPQEFGLAYLLCSLAVSNRQFSSAVDYAKIGVTFPAEEEEIDALNILRDQAERSSSGGVS